MPRYQTIAMTKRPTFIASDFSLMQFLKPAAVAALAATGLTLLMYKAYQGISWEAITDYHWLVALGVTAIALNLSALIWKIYLVVGYRDLRPCSDEELPLITVVVPAYNEGSQVQKTLLSVAASDYPPHKLQIIAVDDGSVDDTWLWMQRAGRELGDRVQLIRQPVNGGKRKALFTAYQHAVGEVLVTIDSDSEVNVDTLRHLVTPIARNPRVGGVAGNVRVLNRDQGLIPRLMDVNFVFSFDFVRAAQSRVNTVACTPGALSAYRISVIAPHMDAWVNQTFMGRPAGIGEDRAITNMILRSGHLVHFSRKAVVYTEVPVTYKGLCKMLLRWARSNVRESLVMGRFIFRRFRPENKGGARFDFLLAAFAMTGGEVLKVAGFYTLAQNLATMGPAILLSTLFAACVPAAIYAIRHKSIRCLWALPYGLFSLVCLSWVTTYALFTAHNNGWLTRTSKKAAPAASPAVMPAASALTPALAVAQEPVTAKWAA